jgi:hypothetical protein
MDDHLVLPVVNNHHGDPCVDTLKEWLAYDSPLWFSDILDVYYECRMKGGIELNNW